MKAGILSPTLTISALLSCANDNSENNAAAKNNVTFLISDVYKRQLHTSSAKNRVFGTGSFIVFRKRNMQNGGQPLRLSLIHIFPANDDATKSVEVILDACCAAMIEGLEERKRCV